MPQFHTSQAPKKRSPEEERIDELTEELRKSKAAYEDSIAKLNTEHTRALDKALNDLRSELETSYKNKLIELKTIHTEEMKELEVHHIKEFVQLHDQITSKDNELAELKKYHDEELAKLHEANERTTDKALQYLRSELEFKYTNEMTELKASHAEAIAQLKSAYDKTIAKLNTAIGFIIDDEYRYKVSLPLYINTISDHVLAEFDNKKTIRELTLCLHFEANGKPITWFAELNEDFIDTEEFDIDIDFEFLDNESKNVTFKLKRSKESPITIEEVMSILKTMNLYITNENETVFIEDEEIKTPSSFDMVITRMEIVF